jgi:hypothetical protein
MKVIHVLKRIELIEEDIRDLKKMEKTLAKNKSFSTPIYMSIEKQINILLGEKIKLLELKIENPPENLRKEMGEQAPEPAPEPVKTEKPSKSAPAKKAKPKVIKGRKAPAPVESITIRETDDIMLLTQDQIDMKIRNMEEKSRVMKEGAKQAEDRDDEGDEHIKLLDIALEKGSLSKSDIETEKKKVRFFKDNFPGKDY